MNKNRFIQTAIIPLVCLVAWAAPAETASYGLSATELSAAMAADCPPQAVDAQEGQCSGAAKVVNFRITSTDSGVLYLVKPAACVSGEDCKVRFVQKSRVGVDTLLTIKGQFRLYEGDDYYPTIMSVSETADNKRVYHRYEWRRGQYTETSNKTVYHVNGTECGNAEQCRAAADTALSDGRLDDAVAIWHTVFGVSWI